MHRRCACRQTTVCWSRSPCARGATGPNFRLWDLGPAEVVKMGFDIGFTSPCSLIWGTNRDVRLIRVHLVHRRLSSGELDAGLTIFSPARKIG